MLWITSKSIFTGTKHFHYGTKNETFLETDRKQGKLNNCLETCRRKINFGKVRTEFIACCKHHNKNCRCTAGYQGSSNHSGPKHIFTALKLLEVFSDTEGPFISKGFKTCIKQNGVKHWSDGRGNKPTASAGDRNQTHKAICLAQLE